LRELIDNGNLVSPTTIDIGEISSSTEMTRRAHVAVFIAAIDFIHKHLDLIQEAEEAEREGHESQLSHIIEFGDEEMRILFEFLLNKLPSVNSAV